MLFHNISMPLIAEESGAATSQTILDGSDTVCRTQDYKFYVNVPEGATVTWGYEFVHKGYSPIDLIFENGKYYGLLNSQNYPEEETSFKVYVTVQTSTGLISNTGVWSSLCFGSADLMAIYCIFQKKRNRK